MKSFGSKGSLSLSINAIVIIVLAMTLLGLGLGFIRGLFADITDTTSTVQEQVKQQILEDLKTGDKKLSFSTNQVVLGRGESEIISIGVKNSRTSGQLRFMIGVITTQFKGDTGKFICTTRDTTTNQCTATDPTGHEAEINDGIDYFFEQGPFTLPLDDAEVYPITVSAEGEKGTYLVKMSILEESPTTPGTYNVIYAEKTFFINVG